MTSAILLTAHGTVERLDDLAPFIANIRRGHAAPQSVVDEVRRRYEAIGGQSPLLAASGALAQKVEMRLGVMTRIAMRLWHPYPKDVLNDLAQTDVTHIAVVALAQFSAAIYNDAITKAAIELAAVGGRKFTVTGTSNWGTNEGLVIAQSKRVQNAIDLLSPEVRKNSQIIFSAHSLPTFIIRGGDSYEKDFRASVDAIVARLKDAPPHAVCFQSQGMNAPGERPVEWLGPDLIGALDDAKARGVQHVIFAPIGFLADHVEILYDLDIEARGWANERGMFASRVESLNASDDFADVIASLASPLLVQ